MTSRLRQRGFTLLEMIVVLVILGLMAGLVLARGPIHSTRLDTQSTARDLAGTLRLARARAIAANRSVTVNIASGAWQAEGTPTMSAPRDVTLAGTAKIQFAPDGSSSGGQIAVQGGDRRIGISVDWLTGRVHVTGDG
jgi:general secretion pathway protein H